MECIWECLCSQLLTPPQIPLLIVVDRLVVQTNLITHRSGTVLGNSHLPRRIISGSVLADKHVRQLINALGITMRLVVLVSTLGILHCCRKLVVTFWATGQLTRFVEFRETMEHLLIAPKIGLYTLVLAHLHKVATRMEHKLTVVGALTGGKKEFKHLLHQ